MPVNNTSASLFMQEAEDLFDQLEQGLLDLETHPGDGALVSMIFRALHTLKGSGSVFGFDALAEFAHHVENVFHKVRSGEIAVSKPLIDATLAAKDYMRDVLAGTVSDATLGDSLLQRLERAAATGTALSETGDGPVASTFLITICLGENAADHGTDPAALVEEILALGTGEVIGPVPPRSLSAGCPPEERTFQLRLTAACAESDIRDVFLFISDEMDLEITEEAPPSPVTEPVTALRSGSPEFPDAVVKVASASVDSLMDQVGELVIVEARLRSLAAWRQDPILTQVAEEIERLTGALRETSMSIRMVGIGTLFNRFRRVVRDLSKDLHKPLRLVTEGEETKLDKALVEKLYDPLLHLIRNAADHGVETPNQRKAAGKPEEACLELTARHAGAEVLVSIRDDGRGLDREKIRERAIASGLLLPDVPIEDRDLFAMIFLPGFSTAQSVSTLSGRGVGLDVVKTATEALRGMVEIQSAPGQGTTFTLRLPLTLAIIDGLMVRVDGQRYVIPLSMVEECVDLPTDGAEDGCQFLSIRDELVPYLRLRDVFGCSSAAPGKEMVVITSAGGKRTGLVVDELLGSHQTVVKSLNRLHRGLRCWSGATILGDGRVALILDVLNMITLRQQQEDQARQFQMRISTFGQGGD